MDEEQITKEMIAEYKKDKDEKFKDKLKFWLGVVSFILVFFIHTPDIFEAAGKEGWLMVGFLYFILTTVYYYALKYGITFLMRFLTSKGYIK